MNEKSKNLLVRTATGIVFAAVMIAAIITSRLTFTVLLACIAVGCMLEFYGLARKTGSRPQTIGGLLLGLLVIAVFWIVAITVFTDQISKLMLAAIGLSVVSILLVTCILGVEIWRRKGNPTGNLGSTFLGAAYVAIPISSLFLIPTLTALVAFAGRPEFAAILGQPIDLGVINPESWLAKTLPLAPSADQPFFNWSPAIVVLFIAVVWVNDIFAYLTGIAFGRHKLWERLSPKKSWEGFFGGVVFAVIAAALAGKYLAGGSALVWGGFGLTVALAAVVGDLLESHFKRSAGVKDSGRLLPGHGGLLDRFDAIFVAAPFALLYLIIVVLVNGAQLIGNLEGLM